MANDERHYYVLCDDNCRFESMTKEQIIEAIAEATGETPVHIDDAFITKIKEQNHQDALKFWAGTEAEFNALSPKPTANDVLIRYSADGKVYVIKDLTPEGQSVSVGNAAEPEILYPLKKVFKGDGEDNIEEGIIYINDGGIKPVDELPTPSAEWENKYVEYHGSIYKCIKEGSIYKWIKIGDEPVPSGFVYSIIVDENNSDPEGACTYADDCADFTPASKTTYGDWETFVKQFFKPCILRTTDEIGSPNYYLNHDNRIYKADGTSAVKTGEDGDCMIEVKSLWYNFEWLDANRYKLSISDVKKGLTWESFNYTIEDDEYIENPYIYLSCYVSPNSSPMKSVVGSPISKASDKASNWRSYASAKGNGYGIFDFRRMLLIQSMMLLLGKNRNTQEQFGGEFKSAFIPTGSLDNQKFISTDVFLGIEGLFDYNTSNYGTYIDRCIHYQAGGIRWTDNISKYGETVAATNNYENNLAITGTNSTFIGYVLATNRGGFLPANKTHNSSETSKYCDYFYDETNPFPHQVYFGTGQRSLDVSSFGKAGVFSLCVGYAYSFSYGVGRLIRYK